MKTVEIGPWEEGFNKVKSTKLFQEYGYSLSEGKSFTDSIMSNQVVRLTFETEQSANIFASKMAALGVKTNVL